QLPRLSMDDSPKMRNCLICSVPITECHLGIDSCRACSVFYKRTIKLNKEWLKCKNGLNDCINRNPTTSCRKCRFQKFSDVLAQSESAGDDQEAEAESESDVEKEASEPSTSFLDHDSFSLIPSQSTGAPLLDRIKNGYSLLCLIRKTSEVLLLPDGFMPTQEEIDNNLMRFFPMTYSMILPTSKVHITALWDFGNSTFEDFRNSSVLERYTIIISSYKFIVLLDIAYRSAHFFPDCDTRLAGYMFSTNDANTDHFLDSVPYEINKEEIAAVFRKNAVKITKLKEHLKRVAPSDTEFALLFGLTFWNNEISNASDPLTPMVERNRKAIMEELHLLYKHQGKLDYAARAGELYDLLASLEEISTLADADLELYKLMNLFTEFTPK
ncbi:hypothetical protein PENTCL1PPCAC_10248, partial [Pristionchus entomophagus]